MDDLHGGPPPDPSGGQPSDPSGEHQLDDLYGAAQPDVLPSGHQPDDLYSAAQPDDLYGEQQVSWLDVHTHSPVLASDGTQVGTVLEVAALANEDIFHGIVFQHSRHGQPCLAPASDVARITDRAVHLSVDSGTADGYGEFQQLHVRRLGLRGISRWKHLGWKDSSE